METEGDGRCYDNSDWAMKINSSTHGNMQFYFLFSKRFLWNEDNMTVMIVIKLMTIF